MRRVCRNSVPRRNAMERPIRSHINSHHCGDRAALFCRRKYDGRHTTSHPPLVVLYVLGLLLTDFPAIRTPSPGLPRRVLRRHDDVGGGCVLGGAHMRRARARFCILLFLRYSSSPGARARFRPQQRARHFRWVWRVALRTNAQLTR